MEQRDIKHLPLLGIEEHDREHREILETIIAMRNTLRGKGTEAHKHRIVKAGLESVLGYLQGHFKVEEGLMRDSHYPAYPKHKAEHEKFLKKVESIREKMLVGSNVSPVESLDLLSDWLHTHICESDRKLMPHIIQAAMTHLPERKSTASRP
jgi:hemerythrin